MRIRELLWKRPDASFDAAFSNQQPVTVTQPWVLGHGHPVDEPWVPGHRPRVPT